MFGHMYGILYGIMFGHRKECQAWPTYFPEVSRVQTRCCLLQPYSNGAILPGGSERCARIQAAIRSSW